MKKNMRINDGGFALVYTVLIITILLITVSGIFSFVINQVKTVRDESEAAKAQYAADAGLECVRYYQSINRAFDTTQPRTTVDCGGGDTITAGLPSPSVDCTAFIYTDPPLDMTINFPNGSCTVLKITVTPRLQDVHGVTQQVCELFIESMGKNLCSASPQNLVQQTRHETM